MIITKLDGGLGNQMLQYSIGKSLAVKLNTNLKIDSSNLERDKDQLQGTFIKRSLKLQVFDIALNEASTFEKKVFKSGIYNNIKIFLASRIKIPNLNIYYKEESRLFDKRLFSLNANLYLEGYWPNHKYFDSIRPTLLRDFTLKHNPDKLNKNLLDLINNCQSVALHIRRSDYITNKDAANHFAKLSLDYYKKGIEFIKNKITNPIFFIFSDDVEWVKSNLKIKENFVICDVNTVDNGFDDLRLMRNCKHFIIANSTLSWWGAWLSENEDKIVIAPQQWFVDEIKNKHEILLSNWIKLPI